MLVLAKWWIYSQHDSKDFVVLKPFVIVTFECSMIQPKLNFTTTTITTPKKNMKKECKTWSVCVTAISMLNKNKRLTDNI